MPATDPRLKRRRDANGEFVTRNGKDVWTAELPLPPTADGKRRKSRFTFVGNKTDANKALVARISEITDGSYVSPDRSAFGAFLSEWLVTSKARYGAKTFERFESMARVHIIPTLGDVSLQKLTAAHLNRAYAGWIAAGLSAQTAKHHHRLIHVALVSAVKQGRVRLNVASIADCPRVDRAERKHFAPDELKAIFAAAEGSPIAAVIALALATGARRGEILAIRWGDVDGSRLAIRRALVETNAGVSIKTPKNGRARVVTLPQSAMKLLEELRPPNAAEGDYVFGDGITPIEPDSVTKRFRTILAKAKVKGGTFHALRHSAATQLLELHVPPKVVQERLGHSSISITLDTYSHVMPSLQEDAAARLDAVLAPILERR
jgi:integrase